MNRTVTADTLKRQTYQTDSLPRLGDLTLSAIWYILAITNVINIVRLADESSWVSTAHRTLSATILVICAVLFVIRQPASCSNQSWRARIVAIAGTWFLPTLIMLPLQWDPGWLMS